MAHQDKPNTNGDASTDLLLPLLPLLPQSRVRKQWFRRFTPLHVSSCDNNPGVCVKAADGAALTGRGANGRNPMALWGERGPLRIIIIIIMLQQAWPAASSSPGAPPIWLTTAVASDASCASKLVSTLLRSSRARVKPGDRVSCRMRQHTVHVVRLG
jgi:hypothetical protein